MLVGPWWARTGECSSGPPGVASVWIFSDGLDTQLRQETQFSEHARSVRRLPTFADIKSARPRPELAGNSARHCGRQMQRRLLLSQQL